MSAHRTNLVTGLDWTGLELMQDQKQGIDRTRLTNKNKKNDGG